MSKNNIQIWPHWVLQVQQYLPVVSQYVLSGNTKDMHLIPTQDGEIFCHTIASLWEALSRFGLEGLLVYDRIDGIRVYPSTATEVIKARLGGIPLKSDSPSDISLVELLKAMRKIVSCRDIRTALVIDYASRLVPCRSELSDLEYDFFSACQKLTDTVGELRPPDSEFSLPFNPIFWIVDRPNDMPGWFTVDNERLKTISIEVPNRTVRKVASERLVRDIPGSEQLTDDQLETCAEKLVDHTEGMTLRGMIQIRSIAHAQGISALQIPDAVRCYKVGVIDNPWKQSHLRERLDTGEESIGESIKGQAAAVQKTLDILKRSVMGLSGAQAFSRGGRPRGVLFFAGPTGVGKTELAKAITRLIFGDEQAYLRFDMSEFSSEHSEARLIGAPPGYIGFDSGGELINAVRQRPFCVILFDEIEKSHPRILDKFLQILEDGRLTGGRGETVYFSEAVIVFTSNLGMYIDDEHGKRRLNVTPDSNYVEVESRVRGAVEEHFRFNLQRPELLNRIGDNIVIFDFIRKSVAIQIFEKMLSNISVRVKEEHGLTIEITEHVLEFLKEKCTQDLANGGRGIGNRLETFLINPLARALFARNTDSLTQLLVTNIQDENGIVSLSIA